MLGPDRNRSEFPRAAGDADFIDAPGKPVVITSHPVSQGKEMIARADAAPSRFRGLPKAASIAEELHRARAIVGKGDMTPDALRE
ncbi:MAG: hypothetical protein BWY09_01012 [Candidatus Hydrogenedentes bacterium ADurb.Bin179]|nr:MAG: hypothetical protein BWY09_01012 [Candidatus Hydrogenedentes bacterium ADurb.Bin179]